MVQEVRIVSESELRRRESVSAYIVFLLVSWFGAAFLDVYAVEPLIQWLQAGDWPTWWLWLLEKVLSVPAYFFGEENPPLWMAQLGADHAPWWQKGLALGIMGIGGLALVTLPFVMIFVVVFTVFFAIAAGFQALTVLLWPLLLLILILVVMGAFMYGFLKGK